MRISSQPDICSPISISSTGMGLGRLALVVSPLRAFYGSTAAGPTCTHAHSMTHAPAGTDPAGGYSWIVLDCLSCLSGLYRPSRSS
eukprot:COSAG01_NODE_132_length_24759_cov_13.862298_8_plen_86_part_00